MTFTELMQVTYCLQPVVLMLGENDTITGNAAALDNYICEEIASTDVKEISVENNVMKVWVDE